MTPIKKKILFPKELPKLKSMEDIIQQYKNQTHYTVLKEIHPSNIVLDNNNSSNSTNTKLSSIKLNHFTIESHNKENYY